MRVLVGAAELAARSRAPWLALLERAERPHPQLHPDYAVQADARVFAELDGDDMVALAVLVPKRVELTRARGLRRLTRLDGLRLAGDGMVGDDRPRAVHELTSAVAEALTRGGADCVLVEDLDTACKLGEALREMAAERGLRAIATAAPQPHWWIRFPEPVADYWNKFKRKSRYNLRRRAKQLEHEVVRIERADQVAAFLRHAETVSRASWQGRRLGVRIQDDDATRAELEGIARAGALRSYLLMQGERPIAFAFAVQHGGYFVYEEIGYDPAFRDGGPGEVLLYRIVEDCIEHRCPRLFDFGAGDAVYKEKFGNHRTESGPLLLVGRGLGPAAAVTIDRARARLDRGARALLQRTGLYERARKLYRR